MKNGNLFFIAALFVVCNAVFAQGFTVSGLLDSNVSLQAGAGSKPEFSYGVEEYANLRVQAKIRDMAVFYGAVNFIAAAGDFAVATAAGSSMFDISGENYTAGIELERLYFRLNGEYLNFDGGLFRLPFGYSEVWGPSDFLNPKNPLMPDARPRAVLGASLAWYPEDNLKLLSFGAAPREPFSRQGGGGLAGVSMDRHWDRASLQMLYSFESPSARSEQGIHRAGMSVKADIETALVMELLYTYKGGTRAALDGLSFCLGADYSFFDGNLIVLAEYLYNGAASSTAAQSGGSFRRENYLYAGFTWRFSDYTNVNAALITGFDDISFTPALTLNYDLFQGAALSLTAQIPLDRDLFSGSGESGELGPLSAGYYCNFLAKLRLRF